MEPEWPGEPGVTLLADGQTVWAGYGCDRKELPFVVIERQELVPSVAKAGQELLHRFAYAACIANPENPVKGRLDRKIFYRGRMVFQDSSKDFEVKPGKWAVAAFIKTVPKAKPGDYLFKLTLSVPSQAITREFPFTLRK